MKIAINTKTTGKYSKQFLNNREHLVTNMVPIVGNSVMNGGFYPLEEIHNSFQQLNFLPAPNGHPKIGNEHISAFHPLATNAFNIGGMVRNPKMSGERVINEFWLDIEIANKSDDGKELIRRIEEGEEVGVSTGLSVQQEITNGTQNGMEYKWIARQLNFDHVAILLNEEAAGAHVGTKLETNTSNVLIANCAVLTDNSGSDKSLSDKVMDIINKNFTDNSGRLVPNAITSDGLEEQLRASAKAIWPEDSYWVWVSSVLPTINTVVFSVESRTDMTEDSSLYRLTYSVNADDQVSLNDDKVKVIKKVEYVVAVDGDVNTNVNNQNEENLMDPKQETKGQDVTNSDKLNVENSIKLLESKGFKINTAEEAQQLQYFIDNRSKFESVINKETEELENLRKELIANSDLEADDVKDMNKGMLVRLSNSFNPPQDYSVNSGTRSNLRVVNSSDDDFEDDYTSIQSDSEGE